MDQVMDSGNYIPLKDRLGSTAWGVLCISGLYACLYLTAYKQLRLWLAVRKVLNDHQSDTSESTQDAASEPAADTLSRTAPWFRYIPLVVKTSAAAPVVAWAWRTYTLGAGFIDIVLIAVCYLGIVMALCTVINLRYTDLAVKSQAITKEKPKGWAVTPTTSAGLLNIISTNWIAFPMASTLLCLWTLTRDSPAWQSIGDAALIVMLCLAPLFGIQAIRASDIRMKHVFWFCVAGTGFLVVTIVTLSIIAITSGPDRKPPPTDDTTDDGFIVWALSRVATKAFFDLCVLIRTAQIGAVLYYPVFALLRFESDQDGRGSEVQYTVIEEADDEPGTGTHDDEEKSADASSSTVVGTKTENVALIPTTVQPFPAPLFKTVLVGGYVGSLLAVVAFPQPNVWDLCTFGAFLGMILALGGRLVAVGAEQRKALWLYGEEWSAKPPKQEEEA
ncbi:hypothetical protein NliqN6_5182 [Naganishia liquefaciens]|uniref:Uncharacterized protein n=1 Tax=Naganishia liquefaciens TaxID=104408 RepID=A0A8H3YGE8_9TREE|nr:hypothetical protein NliqN6_5182 [Naganishia liquefaciens]